MAPTGQSATRGDERSHRFRTIPPKVTIALGEGDPGKQPNSCNHCHTHKQQKPEDLQKALDDGKKLLEKVTVSGLTP